MTCLIENGGENKSDENVIIDLLVDYPFDVWQTFYFVSRRVTSEISILHVALSFWNEISTLFQLQIFGSELILILLSIASKGWPYNAYEHLKYNT